MATKQAKLSGRFLVRWSTIAVLLTVWVARAGETPVLVASGAIQATTTASPSVWENSETTEYKFRVWVSRDDWEVSAVPTQTNVPSLLYASVGGTLYAMTENTAGVGSIVVTPNSAPHDNELMVLLWWNLVAPTRVDRQGAFAFVAEFPDKAAAMALKQEYPDSTPTLAEVTGKWSSTTFLNYLTDGYYQTWSGTTSPFYSRGTRRRQKGDLGRPFAYAKLNFDARTNIGGLSIPTITSLTRYAYVARPNQDERPRLLPIVQISGSIASISYGRADAGPRNSFPAIDAIANITDLRLVGNKDKVGYVNYRATNSVPSIKKVTSLAEYQQAVWNAKAELEEERMAEEYRPWALLRPIAVWAVGFIALVLIFGVKIMNKKGSR